MIKIINKIIEVKLGDITKEYCDAIVNPANSSLSHSGGAALAIAIAGGDIIQRESDEIIKKIGHLPVGKAVITSAGKLPCKFVIHTVGPMIGEGNENNKLKSAVWNSLTLAELYNLRSLSMPAISSGIFGFPKDKCAEILFETTIKFLSQDNINLERVVFCNNDKLTYEIFLEKENKFKYLL
ncbi:MAG: macro domain-containing protein [Caloramator sp.]|nr:macro domain-containing protein [Caloramator sp.]